MYYRAVGLLFPEALSRRSRQLRFSVVVSLGVAGFILLLCVPPIPQDPAYHGFADQSTRFGIPHFGDVITNLAFGIVGCLGLAVFARKNSPSFAFRTEGLAYVVFVLGLLLTGLGSGWYHWSPTTERLFWDRLPMTLCFMSLFCAVISERVSPRLGEVLLGPLVFLGAASVVYWHVGERSGAGDLRFYGFVQFFPMLAIPLLLVLFPARYSHARYFWYAAGCYALAKLFEWLDEPILNLTRVVSGHNLKHLLAVAGGFSVIRMLPRRSVRP